MVELGASRAKAKSKEEGTRVRSIKNKSESEKHHA